MNAHAPADHGVAADGLGAGDAVLAFDVGGTDLKAALVDADGRIVELTRRPTPLAGDRTGEAVVAATADIAAEFRRAHPGVVPAAAGLVVPGHVDEETGVGVFSENLGWRDFPFRDRATAAFGIPVAFSHDVRAAGEAEYRLGAAAGFRDVVVMAIGTGIAGAIFIDGTLFTGGGMAGEMGHSRVADGPDCACGGRGCLEAVASAAAIARRYTALSGVPVAGAKEVLARARTGDPAAQRIWDSALDALALDLSHTVALLAPEAVVIGGGLAQAGDELFVPLAQRLDGILTFQRRPALIAARIGEDAGVIGAALRAREVAAAQAAEPARAVR
ncbi:ROK family protein [Leifsonia shinshuensis]|uniref:Glucokinase n=1 Tax=Leifsonia shinshuensis TaxID=150026 RepID=A0A853CR35_9MICO|nr:glucokinase [Leifsonia shinshuensis]